MAQAPGSTPKPTLHDKGFNELFERQIPPSPLDNIEAMQQQYSELDVNQMMPSPLSSGAAASATGIVGGGAAANNGQYTFDLNSNVLNFNDGHMDRKVLPSPDFIVSLDGNGDFGDIQSAIDFVKTIGGGTILIKPGIYPLLAPLTLSSNINLLGSGIGNTILDFSTIFKFGNATAVELIGTSVMAAGTYSVVNGSTQLIGINTTFQKSNVQPGDSVYIFGVPYQVSSVVNDTTLVLNKPYQGTATGNQLGTIYRPVRNVTIADLTLRNASASGIRLLRAENIVITTCDINGFTGNLQWAGIKIDMAFNSLIFQNYIHDNQRGILFGDILYPVSTPTIGTGTTANPYSIKVIENEIYNNLKDGIRAELAQYLIIASNSCKTNGLAGIFLRMCTDCNVNGNVTVFNKDGIRLWSYDGGPQMGINANCQDISVINNVCNNNSEYGIWIRASVSSTVTNSNFSNYINNLTITANTIANNSVNGIQLDGAQQTVGDSAETT